MGIFYSSNHVSNAHKYENSLPSLNAYQCFVTGAVNKGLQRFSLRTFKDASILIRSLKNRKLPPKLDAINRNIANARELNQSCDKFEFQNHYQHKYCKKLFFFKMLTYYENKTYRQKSAIFQS